MSRTRVIKDIETLDHAIKAEKDVESGYHSVIDENLSYWMAVEEDIVDSYTRMIDQSQSLEMKKTLQQIVDDSKKHGKILGEVSRMLRDIVKDEERHAKMLTNLRDHLEKSQGKNR
jgi:rubrerythrin